MKKSETTDYLNMKDKEGVHCEYWLSVINSNNFTFTGNILNDLKSVLERSCKTNNERLEETYKKAVYDLRYFKEVFELYDMNDNDIYQVANDFRNILERKSVSDFEYNDLVNLWLSRTDNKDKSHFIQDADTAINSYNGSKYNPPQMAINESVKTFDTEYNNDDVPF